MPDNFNSKILSPPKAPTSTAVKMPKTKKLPDATSKPSLFFKSEDFSKVKHPTLCKLRDFLSKTRRKV